MASVVHSTTLALLRSVNTPDFPAPWVVVPEATANTIAAIPAKYRKWVTDHVEEMTQGEKDAVDAAEAMAADDSRMAQLDTRDVVAALALVIRDEFETFAQRINAVRDAVANANNLGDAKAACAAVADAPTRTIAQLKAAIRTQLETLNGG